MTGTNSAVLTTSALSPGTDTVTASFQGNGILLPSSGQTTVQIAYPTTTVLVAAEYTMTSADSNTVTAAVSSSAPSGAPTLAGTVDFVTAEFGTLCSGAVANGIATCDFGLQSYTLHFTAVFNPADGNYGGSTSSPITVVSDDSSTTVTVSTADAGNTTSYGTPPVFNWLVTSHNGVALSDGIVTITSGGTILCAGSIDTNGKGSCQASVVLPAGFDAITATYSGDTDGVPDGSGGLLETITPAPTTLGLTVSEPTGAAIFDTVTLTAQLSGAIAGDPNGAPTGTVQFFTQNANGTYSTLGTPAAIDSNGAATTTVTYQHAGSYQYKAVYSGDTDYGTSSATLATAQVVAQETAPTVSLTTSSNSGSPTTSITLTATLGGLTTGVSPVGNVRFTITDSKANVTTPKPDVAVALVNGVYVATLTRTFAAETYTITAAYDGNTDYPASVASNSVAETIALGSSSVSVAVTTPATGDPTVGDSVTFTATVTPTGATGSVAFTDENGNVLCTPDPTVDSTTGLATCTTSTLAAGPHTIHVAYSGDGGNASATGSVAVTVDGYATTTTLTTAPTTSSYGKNVVLTATVSHTDGTTALAGTVTFHDGTTSLGTVTLGAGSNAANIGTLTLSTLSVGSHSITATYTDTTGDYSYQPSTSVAATQTVVENTTTIAVTSSSSPASPGAAVHFTATVSWSSVTGTPTGVVDFYDGNTKIGTGTTLTSTSAGMSTFTTTTLAPGTHSITAAYVGDGKFLASTSAAISEVVNTTAATLNVSATPSPVTFGHAVTFSGTVSGSLGTPTGSVSISEGGTVLGSLSLTNGAGTFTTSSIPAGTHTFTVVYSGDSNYGTSTGSVVLVVAPASSTTTLASSANPSVVGETVTFSVTVAATGGSADGSVELFDGQASLGTATLTNGTATFSVSSLTKGKHMIQAQYAGDASFGASTSMAITQVVNEATSTTDGGTSSGNDAGTQTRKSSGCDVANGSASGALSALFLLALVVLFRKRSVAPAA